MRAAITAMFLTLACGLVCQADELDDILVKLGSTEHSTRNAGGAALKKVINPGHLPRLIAFYKTAQIMGCYPVVQAIEQKLPKPTATGALRQLVETRTDYGAVYAAMALQRLGDSWGADRMLEQVADPKTPHAQRLNIVNYLTSFGEQGRKMLAELAARTTEKPDLLSRALERLTYQTKGPGEEKILPAYEKTPPTDPQLITALRLYKYSRGDLDMGESLDKDAIGGKLDSTQEYRYAQLIYNAATRNKVDKDRKKVLEHLAKKGKSNTSKVYALKALAKIGHLAAAGRIAAKYRKLKDKVDDYLRREARQIWLDARGAASLQELRRELKQGTLEEKVELAELLLKRDIEDGVPLIYEALAPTAPVEARRIAARAASLVGTRKVTRLVAALLNDADTEVRRNAYSSLNSLLRMLLPYRYVDWAKVGYKGDDPADQRKAAADKLIAWLDKVLPKKANPED